MAVDFFTESSNWTLSPRISFSHNLNQSDAIPVDPNRPHLDPSPDFDFCAHETSDHESSSADELFSDGKILPLQFKSPVVFVVGPITEEPPTTTPTSSQPPPPALQGRKKESLKEIMAEKPAGLKSFCFFRRSSSLNSGNKHRPSSIWSLQLLSRSNSTGSTDQNPKNPILKDTQKAFVQKPLSHSNSKTKSGSGSLQKPPLKKNSSMGKTQFRSYGNGVGFSPVLNIPPPYIPKGTTSLFGLGYFCNRKERKTKKKSFPPNAQ